MSVIYSGTYTNGVVLSSPATQNPATVTAAGYIGDGAGVAVLGETGIEWTVNNYGTIVGVNGSGRYAIELASGGSINNDGVIVGGHNYPTPAFLLSVEAGLGDSTGGTIINSGTISSAGGVAVALGNGDILIIDPGAVFVGPVNGQQQRYGGTGDGCRRRPLRRRHQIRERRHRHRRECTRLRRGDARHRGARRHPGECRRRRGVCRRVEAGERVVFTTAGGTALLDAPHSFHATFAGFAEGDVIDLVGTAADRLSFANHELTVTENDRTVAKLRFAGRYTTAMFTLSPDGNGGAAITLAAPTAAGFWRLQG